MAAPVDDKTDKTDIVKGTAQIVTSGGSTTNMVKLIQLNFVQLWNSIQCE